jgi:predicted porin
MSKPIARTAMASLAAMATVAAAGAAQAQTSVTVYGIIDTAVEYLSNADAAGHSLTRMPSLAGGMFPSRLGFRGSEDLGGGLKAIFTLENGFTPDAGALGQGGRFFGRQAFAGLAGPWGQLTAGRNYNMLYLSTFDVDIFGPSVYGLAALDPFIPNGRSDNSLAYKGTFKGFTVGGTFSLGRDVSAAGGPAGTNCPGENASNHKECREWSTMLRYDTPAWGAVAAYDRLHGGPNAAGGLNSSDLSDTRIHVAGYANLNKWKLGAGIIRRTNDGSPTQPRSNLSYLGAAYRLTPLLTVDGQLARLDYRDSGNDSTQLLLRGLYDLSKRTTVYAAAGRIRNNGTAAVSLSAGGSVGAGLSQTGVLAGIKHTF